MESQQYRGAGQPMSQGQSDYYSSNAGRQQQQGSGQQQQQQGFSSSHLQSGYAQQQQQQLKSDGERKWVLNISALFSSDRD